MDLLHIIVITFVVNLMIVWSYALSLYKKVKKYKHIAEMPIKLPPIHKQDYEVLELKKDIVLNKDEYSIIHDKYLKHDIAYGFIEEMIKLDLINTTVLDPLDPENYYQGSYLIKLTMKVINPKKTDK